MTFSFYVVIVLALQQLRIGAERKNERMKIG
jgi:hypothetical protein